MSMEIGEPDWASIDETPNPNPKVTDKQKLEALLAGWGVPFHVERELGITHILVGSGPYDLVAESPLVSGYCGFYTKFTFDPDGNFVEMGAWE